MKIETAAEKAKRLGVSLISQIKAPKTFSKEEEEKLKNDVEKTIQKYMGETVRVCTCGKEISRKALAQRTPCGIDTCPFGRLTNL